MGFLELLLMSLGISMDAFAVSICKGLSMPKWEVKKGLIVSFYLSLFHSVMPLIGYLLGNTFEDAITSIDHWIAFLLLFFIGSKMIKKSLTKKNKKMDEKVDFKTMFPLALATSIDALAVGITLAFLQVNILLAVVLIGITVFILSFLGVKIGSTFGDKYEKKAQLFGGVILILIGFKILLEHLGII